MANHHQVVRGSRGAGIDAGRLLKVWRASATLLVAAAVLGAPVPLWWYTDDRFAAFSHGAPTIDETIALVAAAGLWVCTAWVVLAVLLTAGTSVPGLVGRVCAWLARAVVPWSLRRVIVVGLGVTLAAGSASAAAAAPAGAGTQGLQVTQSSSVSQSSSVNQSSVNQSSSGVLPYDVSVGRVTAELPPLDRPHTVPQAPRSTVTVRPGDCLWSLAAERLSVGATNQQIAVEWRRWYDLNRAVIGPDPDLLHPGQRLVVPG